MSGAEVGMLQVFAYYDGSEVRTAEVNGALVFNAADVCRILEIVNVSHAVTRLDGDEKIKLDIVAGGSALVSNDGGTTCGNVIGTESDNSPVRSKFNTAQWYVTEPGLYALVLESRKPEAKRFSRWVRHDVLPTIRQTGRYELEPSGISRIESKIDHQTTVLDRLSSEVGGLSRSINRMNDSFDAGMERMALAWEANTKALTRIAVALPQVVPPQRRARRSLSGEVVAECRRLHREGASIYRLAADHGVSDSVMRSAVRGMTYRDVPFEA